MEIETRISNDIISLFNKYLKDEKPISNKIARKYILEAIKKRELNIELTVKFANLLVEESVRLYKKKLK